VLLFDGWYAALETFKQVRGFSWVFLARFKGNRLVRLDRGPPTAVERLPIAAAGAWCGCPGSGQSRCSGRPPQTAARGAW
jgi:hypothetical protein